MKMHSREAKQIRENERHRKRQIKAERRRQRRLAKTKEETNDAIELDRSAIKLPRLSDDEAFRYRNRCPTQGKTTIDGMLGNGSAGFSGGGIETCVISGLSETCCTTTIVPTTVASPANESAPPASSCEGSVESPAAPESFRSTAHERPEVEICHILNCCDYHRVRQVRVVWDVISAH